MSLVALLRRSVSLKGPAFTLCRYSSSLPTPPNLSVLDTPEDTEKARTWISEFEGVSIPRNSVELQFARSSGPGGQVINEKIKVIEETLIYFLSVRMSIK